MAHREVLKRRMKEIRREHHSGHRADEALSCQLSDSAESSRKDHLSCVRGLRKAGGGENMRLLSA